MRDLISIVIPVYNAEKYLEETIRSVLRQSYPDFELILVDDGSRDKSAEIYGRYAEEDARIRIIRQENAGPAQARNNGVINARGKYLVFLDSDDLMHPKALEMMAEQMGVEGVDLAIGMYAVFYDHQDPYACPARCYLSEDGTRVMTQTEVAWLFGEPKTSLLGVSIWGKMYRMDLIRKYDIRFPDGISYEEDCCFNLQYYRHIRKAAALHATVNYYRQRANSITKSYNKKQFGFLVNGYNERKKFAAELKLPKLSKKMDVIFFLVIVSTVKKVASSSLSRKEKMEEYEKVLVCDASRAVLKDIGTPKGKLSRQVALLGAKGDVQGLSRVLRLWNAKENINSLCEQVKNKVKGWGKK